MTPKTFRVTSGELSKGLIAIPFDPREAFGKARAPVKVTINGHTFRSTVASMGQGPFVPLRRRNREAAAIAGQSSIEVRIEPDAEVRDVMMPADLAAALKKTKGAWEGWSKLSYTHRREHVEAIQGAKKPETRVRRIENAVRMVVERRIIRA